ncbi:MAG: hypothetical protein NWE89_09195 [Candidatus Bathyarchaeota archaeon]|nr:hypothetical protein [Candidatus Bathyarchaeota archaeon]
MVEFRAAASARLMSVNLMRNSTGVSTLMGVHGTVDDTADALHVYADEELREYGLAVG